MSELASGTVVGGGYRVLRRIGGGGGGDVYEVAHPRLAGRYALKVLGREFAKDEEAVARFRREAEVTSALRHPGIVQVVDFEHAPGSAPYLVMEYLDGRELTEVIRAEAPMPPGRAAELVEQIASALAAAHRNGVVHRDLKPGNVFVMKDPASGRDQVKIVDFGISKLEDASVEITSRSAVLGTPRYMSPEQALGRNAEIDARSDQFALGAIAYQLLTGRPVFDGESLATIAYQIVHLAPTPACAHVPALPEAVDGVLGRALAKRRDERFADVIAMSAALREALAGSPAPRRRSAGAVVGMWAAGGLALLGLIDIVLRCGSLGVMAGLRAAASEPAKTLFHLWFLPAAAVLTAQTFPTSAVRLVMAAHTRLMVLAVLICATSSCVLLWNELHEGACRRLTAPEDVRDPDMRAKLHKLRTEVDLRDERAAARTRAEYAGLLTELRGETCSPLAVSSTRAMFSGLLSSLGVALIGFAVLLMLVGAIAPASEATRPRELALSLMAFVSPWLPLRAYSEWMANFSDPGIGGYAPFLPLLLIGFVALFMLLAQPERRRSLVTTAATLLGICLLATLTPVLAPGAFARVAQVLAGQSATNLFGVEAVVVALSLVSFLRLRAGMSPQPAQR